MLEFVNEATGSSDSERACGKVHVTYQDTDAGISRGPTIEILAHGIQRHAASPGDHGTAIAALSFHRRNAPTDSIPCIYSLSLAVTAQGRKQVLLGDKIFDSRPGDSIVTTVDLPIVSHVTRATRREPYLGLLLRLESRSIALAAAEMKPSRSDEGGSPMPISIARLDPALIGALHRLIEILDDPLLPRLAPLTFAR